MLITNDSKIYAGDTEIVKAYQGTNIVFEKDTMPYQQVNWLEINNRYFNTYFYPNQDTKVEIKLNSSATNAYWFGALSQIGGSFWNTNVYAFCNDGASYYVGYGYQSTAPRGNTTGEAIITLDKNVAKIDDNVLATLNYETFSPTVPIFLGKQNRGGSAIGSGWMNFSYCKIWDNGTLVRDFVPVLDNNNDPCLYDKVNKELYYSLGTGTISYG